MFNRLSEEAHPRCGATRDSVKRSEPSGLDRGRHLTDASQVGPHPRIAAGSTVVSYWLRLFRYTRARANQDDVKKFSTKT
jgi:hypothetical protein